ncbi:RNA polymerase sigma factor [Porticoccaceae bacterium LTM1]|nr:RNA polymerase sigma factor [Porticoccaceae bacterium LTM1]
MELLYRDHGAALRSFLIGRVRDVSDIEDVIHEIFLRLSKQDDIEDRLKESPRKNRAYLFTMANNLVVDWERRLSVRRRYQSAQILSEESNAYELSPEIVIAATQELDAVKAAIRQLDPKWRQAFLLARFKGLSRTEISEIMGVSIRQIETYLSRALIELRNAVPNRGGDYE